MQGNTIRLNLSNRAMCEKNYTKFRNYSANWIFGAHVVNLHQSGGSEFCLLDDNDNDDEH